jgi:hypothetical protein
MQSQGATAFGIPCTTLSWKLHITIVSSCRWTIVANRNDSGILRQYGSYMLFDAMGSLGEIYRQFHIDIVKIRSAHGYNLSKIAFIAVDRNTFFVILVFFS